MRNLRLVLLATLFAGAPASGSGQVSRMRNWWDGPIARDLNLSDEQNKQIRATVRESRDRLIKLRGEVEAAEAELTDQMSEDKIDSHKAEAAIERVVKARGDLTRAFSQMSLKLRLILTPAQWQELQKREREPHGPPDGPMRGLGPGGRGRRPPPLEDDGVREHEGHPPPP